MVGWREEPLATSNKQHKPYLAVVGVGVGVCVCVCLCAVAQTDLCVLFKEIGGWGRSAAAQPGNRFVSCVRAWQ